MKKIKLLFKKYWDLLLSKTTVDEKVIEVHQEVKRRAKRVKEELVDVKDELEDVVDAVKGKKRSGRKSKKK
tara:strand:- start:522 stop:734 length:213 start_codon:yes stop_codon:yes gene_type:complete